MWRCQYCETFNNDDSVVCEVCGNSKGTQSGMPDTVSAEPAQSHMKSESLHGMASPEAHSPAALRISARGSAPVLRISGRELISPPHISGSEHAPRIEPVPEPAPEETVRAEHEPRKKGGRGVWLVIILIILVAGGTASWLMFKAEIMAFVGIEVDSSDDEAANSVSGPNNAGIGGMLNDHAATVTNAPANTPYAAPTAEEIAHAQELLCLLGLLDSDEYTPGQYDDVTAAAVLDFHQTVNLDFNFSVLPEDGTFDTNTVLYLELYTTN